MSSGSYFTIYRKHSNNKLDNKALNALKNEYFLANKDGIFYADSKRSDADMKNEIPVLMEANYKAKRSVEEADKPTSIYYDANGIMHEKLLDFNFGSAFTCLKEHFGLSPYCFSKMSVLISKSEAKKILQAVEYVLSECYDKKFEDILDNEYVKIFGEGYSLFDRRFKASKDPIYIDKDGHGYTVNFNDYRYDAETSENDDDMKFNLSRTKACILAFLNAEECTWDGEELVLAYSAW